MRLIPVFTTAALLCAALPAMGQEWIEFSSRDDRFTCNFPAQPKVTTTRWTSEYGAVLPTRVYSAEDAGLITAGLDLDDAAIKALDGAFMSAFVRARKP